MVKIIITFKIYISNYQTCIIIETLTPQLNQIKLSQISKNLIARIQKLDTIHQYFLSVSA